MEVQRAWTLQCSNRNPEKKKKTTTHVCIKPTFIWNHKPPGMEQKEGRRVAIWWTLIRPIRHILRCLQPDVTHGSHYSPQSNNLAQTKIIKKGKKKRKKKTNVLAFIQPTNATFRAMFSWLNTNTRLLWNDFFSPFPNQAACALYLFV